MDSDKADAQSIAARPFLITFSGIDGAGKTTQIERLSSCLRKQGLRLLRLSFWDDVAVWSRMRAGVGQRAVDFHRGEGKTEHSFVPRNNKHVQKWYLSAARSGLYLLDVARLRRLLASQRIKNSDVVIFDRFIYDQIANIYSQSLAARTYGKLLLKLAPAPDLAFILDASPAAAFARKPEYPLEFMYQNRRNFLHLQELVPQLIVIPDARMDDVTNEIYMHVVRTWRVEGSSKGEEKTEASGDNAVLELQSSCKVQNHPTANI